jgi:hypothetical protein
MTPDRLQALDEMVTELFRDGAPISTRGEPSPATLLDQPSTDEPALEASIIEIASDEGNATTMAEQPGSAPLAGLDLDTAIRLRWALRDIKAERTKLSPVRPDDLRMLAELGLIEMRDDEPVLTNEGHRALDWS